MSNVALRSILVSLALALVATAARAETPSDDVRVHASRAEGAYALNEFAEAAREYELAFKLKPQPALLFNAAQAHRLAGNHDRARALYQSYLKVYYSRISNRAEVEEIIRKLDDAAAVRKVSEGPPLGNVPVASPPPVEPSVKPSTVAPPPPEPARPLPLAPPPATPVVASPPAVVDIVAPAPIPVTRRPAFWAGLSAGVVAVAAGVTAGVVVGTAQRGPTAHEQIVFDQGLAFGGVRW